MERPTGVTVLAILDFLGALILICAGLAFLLGMGIAGAGMMSQARGGGAFLAGLGAIGGVVFLVFAAISALIGIGLWKLKNWARIVTIVFSGLGILGGLLGLLTALLHFSVFTLVFRLVFIGIYALIIWYMLQPDVKKVFGVA